MTRLGALVAFLILFGVASIASAQVQQWEYGQLQYGSTHHTWSWQGPDNQRLLSDSDEGYSAWDDFYDDLAEMIGVGPVDSRLYGTADMLNLLGKAGWELASAIRRESGSAEYLLKRPLVR